MTSRMWSVRPRFSWQTRTSGAPAATGRGLRAGDRRRGAAGPRLVGHDRGAVALEGDLLGDHGRIVGRDRERAARSGGRRLRRRRSLLGTGGLDPERGQDRGGGGHAAGDVEDAADQVAARHDPVFVVLDELVDEIGLKLVESLHSSAPLANDHAAQSASLHLSLRDDPGTRFSRKDRAPVQRYYPPRPERGARGRWHKEIRSLGPMKSIVQMTRHSVGWVEDASGNARSPCRTSQTAPMWTSSWARRRG